MIHYEELPSGFEFGSMSVTRVTTDDKRGWVVLAVDTPKTAVQVYATKTGRVRLVVNGKELKL